MSDDLRRKLRRLGVSKGARHLKPAPPVKPESASNAVGGEAETAPESEDLTLADIMPGGQILETAAGPCFVVDHVMPFNTTYGPHPIAALFDVDLVRLAQTLGDDRLAGYSARDLLFLDIETRGLMQTGAEVIEIGLAFFEENAFVVRFLFARDLGEEGALLEEVKRLTARFPVLVTFNGKAFDLRFLDGRAILNRMFFEEGALIDRPHIDLLGPARRLWRHLPSVALSRLDQQVLGVKRSAQEIPGWQVPVLYNRYLVDRDPRPLRAIFEHNRYDMLAMVALLIEIDHIWKTPDKIEDSDLLFNLARRHVGLDYHQSAEQLFRRLLDRPLTPAKRVELLKAYAQFLKRQDRRAAAVPLWQELAELDPEVTYAHIELAKYYEWHAPDLKRAAEWAAHAYQIVISQKFVDQSAQAEIEHRLVRLAKKRG